MKIAHKQQTSSKEKRFNIGMLSSAIAICFLLVLGSASTPFAQNSNPNAEQIQKAIIGKWKVISFQRVSEPIIDFSKDNYIWEFTADKDVKINSLETGQFTDKYRVITSVLQIGRILIMVPKLANGGFGGHGKFIVREISDDGKTLKLGDWNDTLLYTIIKTG